MDHLRRSLAPVSDAAWEQIDQEAARTLAHYLAGRPMVDVAGPLGWTYSAAVVGRAAPVASSLAAGVVTSIREVQSAIELRTPFTLDLAELDAADRGGDVDLTALIDAAKVHAMAEETAVFYGHKEAGVEGIASESPHAPIALSERYDEYPSSVAQAVATLRRAGVGGPYALALGPRCYTGVIETSEHGGYPLLEHLKLITGGPVVWAPSVDGAVVVSLRGGDYELTLGEDVSIGYRMHTADAVELYFEESFTFLIRDERAAVALRYG